MKEIINLGNIPLVNNLFDSEKESVSAKRYPLRVMDYGNLLMKLDTEVDSNEMFSKYLYHSGVSKPFVNHCKAMARDIKVFTPRTIVDIGGNDGTLLSAFRDEFHTELECTNVDASSSFKELNEQKGIRYVNAYWGDIKLEKKADAIISTNVFQHTPDYRKFLQGISDNLDGIWVLEFPYFLDTVQTNQFDQIYHEHVYYWLVTPLVELFKEYGLKIIDIERQAIHGGTLRIISSNKKNSIEHSAIVDKYLKLEASHNFNNWHKAIQNKITIDKNFLENLYGDIMLFGAAAKGCTYLNSVTHERFKYVIDDTKEKQGKFIPGTSIKVVPRTILSTEKPDYILILAHNFKEHIIKSLKDFGYTGKYIVMLPNISIL